MIEYIASLHGGEFTFFTSSGAIRSRMNKENKENFSNVISLKEFKEKRLARKAAEESALEETNRREESRRKTSCSLNWGMLFKTIDAVAAYANLIKGDEKMQEERFAALLGGEIRYLADLSSTLNESYARDRRERQGGGEMSE